ncbi:MAG: hypothetical protein Q4G16_04625 [Cruoricaptor ignavus]|nr:hypothetical protein [Cruoricaptor ignavus]
MTIKKTFLLIFLLFHIFCVVIVNLSAFVGLQKEEVARFNWFGKKYIDLTKNLDKNEIVSCYTNLTGTNRGYEFFSPNVSNFSLQVKFLDENANEIPLYRSFESITKFGTASYYLNSSLLNQKKRNEILASYSKRIFAMNENINKINVVLEVQEYKSLKHKCNNGVFKKKILCTIEKL